MTEPEIVILGPFPNGLTVLLEPMQDVRSAAWTILTPAGAVAEPRGKNGAAIALCDWLLRGAGDRDNRALSGEFDRWGVQRHESVTSTHLAFHGAALGDHLAEILPLYADVLRRPHLAEEEFEAVMIGVEQTLLGMEDDPRQKVMVDLARQSYADPWGRSPEGSLKDLPRIDERTVRRLAKEGVRPAGTIFGIAGQLDVPRLSAQIEELFGDWASTTTPQPLPAPGAFQVTKTTIEQPTSQTHIGVAYPSVPYKHADFYAAWAVVDVLSGGMSSRLFTEIREKRGLCYSVSASLHTTPEEGRVFCYAGSAPERAQETLDVLISELRRLPQGIAEEELQRCKARAKSALIMAQESTGSRAGSLARDWFHLGRVTTLEEIRQRIEALTVQDLLKYIERFPAQDLTVLTVGPNALVSAGSE